MKVAIVGSRDFNDYEYLEACMESIFFHEANSIDWIISGSARGADRLGEKYAWMHSIPLKVFPAMWDEYGKKAGYLRNIDIVDAADIICAFWDGESKGTKHTIDIAKKKGKTVHIFSTGRKE